MKRLFFVLSLVLVCSSIFSQEKEWKVKGFEPQIRLSFDEGVDYQKNFSFGADFVAAYRFNEIIRLGAGVGVDYVNMRFEEPKYIGYKKYDPYYEAAMTIPIFANIKVDFLKTKASPYLAADCGYNIFIPFSKYAQDAIKAVKIALNKQSFESKEIISTEDGGLIYRLKKNTQNRYNPFAGNFRESLSFRFSAKWVNEKVEVLISDMTLESNYVGYGQRNVMENLSVKIAQYEETLDKAANGKGKEKKEAKELIVDLNESLNLCEEELGKVLNAIQQAL